MFSRILICLLVAAFALVYPLAQNYNLLAQLPFFKSLTGNEIVVADTATPSGQPNIIFIFTDDQDELMQSTDYMPYLQKHIFQEGTRLTNHYCTTALCCPSRVSLLRGQLAHNTNVTDVHPPYGGLQKFLSQGFNDDYLPVWLKEAGYDTYYIGKIINQMTIKNYKESWMNGWDDAEFLLDPYTYVYYNATFARNGGEPKNYPGEYSSDVIAGKTYDLLDNIIDERAKKESAGETPAPFFFVSAPISAHTNMEIDLEKYKLTVTEPQYPERHANLFKDVKLPRNENFNPDSPSGASWVRNLPKLNETMEDVLDEFYRARLRSLQSVDEMIDGIFKKLEDSNLLENTYIIYSTDNGFHLGTHRCGAGKGTPYEEDINVPFAIRGPGIAKNRLSNHVSGHVDLAPTFFKLANIENKPFFDGKAIPVFETELDTLEAQRESGVAILDFSEEHTQVEYWGPAVNEQIDYDFFSGDNTYKALRLISTGYNLYYSTWCTGEIELYDMIKDPYQMHNLVLAEERQRFIDFGASIPGDFALEQILTRLNALLLILKDCKEDQCRHPWRHIHSRDGTSLEVNSIVNALDSKYDNFYASVEQISFSSCPKGHVLSEQGAQWTYDQLIFDTAT